MGFHCQAFSSLSCGQILLAQFPSGHQLCFRHPPPSHHCKHQQTRINELIAGTTKTDKEWEKKLEDQEKIYEERFTAQSDENKKNIAEKIRLHQQEIAVHEKKASKAIEENAKLIKENIVLKEIHELEPYSEEKRKQQHTTLSIFLFVAVVTISVFCFFFAYRWWQLRSRFRMMFEQLVSLDHTQIVDLTTK